MPVLPENCISTLHPPPSTMGCGNAWRRGRRGVPGWAEGTKEPHCWDSENRWKEYGSFQEDEEETRLLWWKALKLHHDTANQNILVILLSITTDIFASYIILSRSEREKQSDLWEMVRVRVNICTAWKKCATSSELIFLLWSTDSHSALPICETQSLIIFTASKPWKEACRSFSLRTFTYTYMRKRLLCEIRSITVGPEHSIKWWRIKRWEL